MRKRVLSAAIVATTALGLAPSAGAATTPPSRPIVKDLLTKADRSVTFKAPIAGFLTVRTAASDRSDWDLDLRDAKTGQALASSHGFGSHEVAQAYVTAGQKVVARGTKLSGRANQARVSFKLFDVPLPKVDGIPSLVTVKYSDDEDLARIEAAGLDLTHDIAGGQAAVIVTGAAQFAALKGLNLPFDIEVPDLNRQTADARAADARAVGAEGGSALPSGREEYRVLQDYQDELKALVDENPGLVKPVVLPERTFQGREIMGVEIATDVERTDDGRPTYFLMGMHHAREWPSAESAMEFAHLLVDGADSDPRIQGLLDRERVVVVPIINVDGFVESREGGALGIPDPADTIGEPTLETVEGVALLGGSFAYRRKNCDGAIPSGSVPCTLQWGVDPNRNYGNGWGGPGAGTDPITQSYRGTGPFSEPETRAVWEFSRERQVTMMITLHNVAALVLRPPGLHEAGKAPDEDALKSLGDAMADAAGYTSQYGFELYDTSGTTDDYTYAAQGGYAYTIEIGPQGGAFHMPYETGVVQQWTGTPGTPSEGKGLREALLLAAESGADPASHAVLTGRAKPGTVLRIRKDFQTLTSERCAYAQGYLNSSGGGTPLDCVGSLDVLGFDDKLESTMTTPASGKFSWDVLPSTRPFVGARVEGGGLEPTGNPQTFASEAGETHPLPSDVDDQAFAEREFTLTGNEDAVQIDLTWGAPAEDYDFELYRVLPDGSRVGAGSSGNAPPSFEQYTMSEPQAGTYVLKVIYYAAPLNDWEATIQPMASLPEQVVGTGETESFTFTCETPDGTVLASREITVARGQQLPIKAPECGGRGDDRDDDGPGDDPPGGGPGGDSTAPKQKVSARLKQDVDKLVLTVFSDEDGTAAGQASVKVPGAKKAVKSKPASASVGANQSAKLRFKFSKKSLRAIKSAIDKGKRPKAKISVATTDGSGNASASETVAVKLKN